jgi:hypothetical protein
VDLLGRLHPLLGTPRLSAAVYTQTTDVEIEVNGLMTYDRALIKGDEARLRAANLSLFTTPPAMKPVVEPSRDSAVEWRYTTAAPPSGWFSRDFDDAAWASGPGGFGARNPPGSVVRTVWNTPDIWLRRSFDLPAGFTATNPKFIIHHDEDVEVYINGVLALKAGGYSTDYEIAALTPEGRAALTPGSNVFAVHCRQTSGGQYIDVGIIDLIPAGRGRRP